MPCYPIKWGFIRDLRQCTGKTIETAYLAKMEWGCVDHTVWLVEFTDGTRAFFGNHPLPDAYTMNPANEEFQRVSIFTPEEVAEVAADRKRKVLRAKREARARKLAQLARLKKELGIEE